VRAAKIGLLIVILMFGASIETAWQVREHVGIGPMGCRVLGGKLYGASFVFESNEERAVPAGGAVAVENAFGDVSVRPGETGTVRVALRKVVYRPKEDDARAFADRVRIVLREESGRLVITTNREELDPPTRRSPCTTSTAASTPRAWPGPTSPAPSSRWWPSASRATSSSTRGTGARG
jgi:hypothetical protein